MKHLLETRKIPTTKDNYIGVEIEFLLHRTNVPKLHAKLIKAGVEYNVHVGEDGSVRDLEWVPQYQNFQWGPEVINNHMKLRGMEIRILATEKELTNVVQKVCKVIKSLKGKVNSTCGLHVHLDMRHRKFDDVFLNFFYSQKLLFKTQPKERMVGKYSKLLRKATTNPTTRYYGVNKLSYKEHRTLEIRMHEGSIDEKEILVWVGTLIKIANFKLETKRQIKTFEQLGLPQKVQEYFDERIQRYSGKQNTQLSSVG